MSKITEDELKEGSSNLKKISEDELKAREDKKAKRMKEIEALKKSLVPQEE